MLVVLTTQFLKLQVDGTVTEVHFKIIRLSALQTFSVIEKDILNDRYIYIFVPNSHHFFFFLNVCSDNLSAENFC